MYLLKTPKTKTYPMKDFRNGALSPSSLGMVYNCSGYRLLADTDDSPTHPITLAGQKFHKEAERRIKIGLKKGWHDGLSDFSALYGEEQPDYDFIGDYVADAVKYKDLKPSLLGTEIFLADIFYSDFIGGYVDFIGYRRSNRELHIWDLKTGVKPTTEAQKYQLYFYAIGALNYLNNPDVDFITLRFYTRYGVQEYSVLKQELLSFKRHVSEKIRRMEFTVGNHCRDCFYFKKCVTAHKKAKNIIKTTMKKEDTKEWGDLFRYRGLISKFYDFVEEEILNKHYETHKDKIGPFEVYETRGRKTWIKEKMPLILKMKGLTESVVKPISVKKALDKGLKIDGLWDLKKTKKIKLTKKEDK